MSTLRDTFTIRERQVARLIEQGCSRSEVAEALDVTVFAIDKHLQMLFAKTGARTCRRLQALLAADGSL